jgi:hypothetical protein
LKTLTPAQLIELAAADSAELEKQNISPESAARLQEHVTN